MPNPISLLKVRVVLISLFFMVTSPQVRADSDITLNPAPATGPALTKSIKLETDMALSAGYRQDDLDWNIAGYLTVDNYVVSIQRVRAVP